MLPTPLMQAIVLAGGLGTRLRAVVADRPKVLADIGGQPFLERLLRRLRGQGVGRVVLAVGYLHEQIQAHFGSAFEGLELAYSIEDEPLGTGGAVQQALRQAEARACFVLNGDTWLDLDMAAMQRAHVAADALVSMAVRQVPDVGRYGALTLEQGRVTGFVEKGRGGAGWINAGVYLVQADLFARWPMPQRFSIEHDFLMPKVGALRPLAFETAGEFIDIGLPEDYGLAQRSLAGASDRGG